MFMLNEPETPDKKRLQYLQTCNKTGFKRPFSDKHSAISANKTKQAKKHAKKP